MKPRLFINMHYMEFGGAERALLGLLNAIDTERVEVDLFLNQHTGAFMPLIPKKINLLPEIRAYSAIERPMKDIFFEGHWGILAGRLLGKLRMKRYLRSIGKDRDGSYTQYAFDGVISHLPSLKHLGHYNAAISFIDPPHIVQDKVDADIRMEWVHTDFEVMEHNRSLCRPRWEKNDFIIAISEAIGEQFKRAYHGLEDKVRVIENIISPAVVRHEAEAFVPEEYAQDGRLIFCSIGRIAKVKNFTCIPFVAKLLKEKGLKFDWFIIGPGDATAIESDARSLGVDDCVHCIGSRNNPYPYIKHCDIYVQPSLREGKSITVREAQILGRPVVITNFATAASHVQSGVDGVICEMENEDIAAAIYSLASDSHKRLSITEYHLTHDYGNEREIDKIYQLLNC